MDGEFFIMGVFKRNQEEEGERKVKWWYVKSD